MYSTLDLQKLVQMLNFLGFAGNIAPPHSVVIGGGWVTPGASGTLFASNGPTFDPSFQTLAALGIQGALGYTPAHSGANSDITSLLGLSTPLSIPQGGTGANTATGALTALGAQAALGFTPAHSGANTDITSLANPAIGSATATTQPRGTNNTQVATAAFVAAHSGAISILDHGGKGDGVTDNTVAFNAAVTAAQAIFPDKVAIVFPPGNYYFASGITYTHPSSPAYGAVSFVGAGVGSTQLIFASGVGVGIAITHQTLFDNTVFQGMTILTKGVGADIGIKLILNTGLTPPLDSAVTFRDVDMRGADGFAISQFWNYCVYVLGVSNVNFYNCNFSGITNANATGVYVVENSPSQIPVVYNFVGCQFNYMGIGFNYGANVQGVTFTACNFVGNNIGIYIAPSISGMDQLTVTGCQFNSFQNSIFINSPCGAVSIVNNYFLVQPNANGISMSNTLDYSIVGNVFNPTIIPITNSNDIVIGAWHDNAGIITGNSFLYATTAVTLGASSQFVNVQSNVYAHCTSNVSNSGTNNTLGGVTGATN